jgi:hypothetical protein
MEEEAMERAAMGGEDGQPKGKGGRGGQVWEGGKGVASK